MIADSEDNYPKVKNLDKEKKNDLRRGVYLMFKRFLNDKVPQRLLSGVLMQVWSLKGKFCLKLLFKGVKKKLFRDTIRLFHDRINSVHDRFNSVRDGINSVRDEFISVYGGKRLVRDRFNSVHDGKRLFRDRFNSVRDGISSISDE